MIGLSLTISNHALLKLVISSGVTVRHLADLLGLNTGGFHRVGVLLGVSVGHLIEIEDGREVLWLRLKYRPDCAEPRGRSFAVRRGFRLDRRR